MNIGDWKQTISNHLTFSIEEDCFSWKGNLYAVDSKWREAYEGDEKQALGIKKYNLERWINAVIGRGTQYHKDKSWVARITIKYLTMTCCKSKQEGGKKEALGIKKKIRTEQSVLKEMLIAGDQKENQVNAVVWIFERQQKQQNKLSVGIWQMVKFCPFKMSSPAGRRAASGQSQTYHRRAGSGSWRQWCLVSKCLKIRWNTFQWDRPQKARWGRGTGSGAFSREGSLVHSLQSTEVSDIIESTRQGSPGQVCCRSRWRGWRRRRGCQRRGRSWTHLRHWGSPPDPWRQWKVKVD